MPMVPEHCTNYTLPAGEARVSRKWREMPSKKSATYALRVRNGTGASSLSYLYVKAHSEAQDNVKSGVFVTGLRANFDQQFVKELFAVFGEVEQVVVHKLQACVDACSHSSKQGWPTPVMLLRDTELMLVCCRLQLWWCLATKSQ